MYRGRRPSGDLARISVDEVSWADAAPLDNLAPTFDALELRDQLPVRQPAEVVHGINLSERYAFSVPEAVQRGELRPLREPVRLYRGHVA
jgi:hypothetical protein